MTLLSQGNQTINLYPQTDLKHCFRYCKRFVVVHVKLLVYFFVDKLNAHELLYCSKCATSKFKNDTLNPHAVDASFGINNPSVLN